jgi:1,4-alpha-glucan branching enzyme
MLYLDYSRDEGQWEPNAFGGNADLDAVTFLGGLTHAVRRLVPGAVTVAEESTDWPGVTSQDGLGFTFKWDLGWMHETLAYVRERPEHRQHHHRGLTFPMLYNASEAYVLPLSHDEVVHGKGSVAARAQGTQEQRLATLRTLLAHQWAHAGKQLVFMGTEIGTFEEWDHDGEVPWWLLDHAPHQGVRECVRSLNRAYLEHPSLWRRDHEHGGLVWLDADNADARITSWVRWGDPGDEPVVCIGHWHHEPVRYRVGLPTAGPWRVLLDTDARSYGGTGHSEGQSVVVEDVPWQGQPCSAVVTLAGLSAMWLSAG